MRLLHILGFASLFAVCLSAGCVVKEKELCSGAFEPDNQACSLQYCEQHRSEESCIEFLNKLDAGFAPDVEGKPDGSVPPTDNDDAGDEPDARVGAVCSAHKNCPKTSPYCLDGSCHKCTSGDSCAFRAETPICNLVTGACVACTESSPGACADQGLVCVVAAAEAEPEAKPNTCVACNAASDCTNPAESACNAEHSCQPCSDSEQHCKHVTDLPVCLSGTCVACQPGQLDACGGKACNMVSGAQPVCSDKTLHSANVCEPCVSDEHCAVGQACVNITWDGSNSWFCQWKKNTAGGHACGASDRPYVHIKEVAATADAKGRVELCTLLEPTSCQALADHRKTSCGRFGEGPNSVVVADVTVLPEGTPASEIKPDSSVCGEGGICRPRSGAGNTDVDGAYRCTVICAENLDCPSAGNSTCQGISIGGTGYCSI